MANNVSIATKPLVYSTFRYINNKVWNALAEYIDNSIQSFEDHRAELEKINVDGKLHIRIEIDFSNDTITITDDAYGITEQNYQRAFELANLPLDNQGLNEFGMGMKVSSIWLSNTWTVETSAYGEPIKKTVVFDLQKVVENEELALPVKEVYCQEEVHYTKIVLQNLSMNKPTSRQLNYIKKHLASIYTQYLRENSVEIVVNDELLKYKELDVLTAPPYNNLKGNPVVWRKDISFEAAFGEKKYSVKGFIGILETMSTSEYNGFLLFRRGRVIGSSYDERYRPKALCGQEGSPQYKRIFGELYLEGFDVSFTKNSFQEGDDFNMLIELLKEDLSKDKSFCVDFFIQAQNYTKPKTKKEVKNLAVNLVKHIASGLSNPLEKIANSQPSVASIDNHQDIAGTQDTVNEFTNPTDLFGYPVTHDELQIPPIKIDVPLEDGQKIPLIIKGEKSGNNEGLYTLTKLPDSEYIATINLSNPIFERFSKSLSSQEGIEQLAYVIEVMVATEISMNNVGQHSHFRVKFNKLFGVI